MPLNLGNNLLHKEKNIKACRQITTRISPELRKRLERICEENRCRMPVASNILVNKIKCLEEDIEKLKKRMPGFNFRL